MTREWFSISDLLDLGHPDLPGSRRGLLDLANDCGWDQDTRYSRDRERRGGGREYHIRLLPPAVQRDLMLDACVTSSAKKGEASARSEALWAAYRKKSKKQKDEAERRLAAVKSTLELSAAMPMQAAIDMVARNQQISAATLRRYLGMVKGYDRSDWLAALTPRHVGGQARADCHPSALQMLKSDYYRPEGPTFKACYERMIEAADVHGWEPIPSAKTLKRRIEKEVGAAAGVMMREGRRAAERLMPSLRRTRDHMTAMEAVNADGHLLDIAVRFEDGQIGRAVLVGFQDVYSGMLLSHRIARTESQELIRLALADMVDSWGIPAHAYFDNGRAFMSKMLTGRMKFRFRFKIKDEDPTGILENLGVKVHPVRPYHGQSKPIERAWGDLAERISRHPKLAGAYLGPNPLKKPENYGNRAIPIDELRAFVAGEVRRHNLREGRGSHTAKGRSLWETFRESYEAPTTLIRRATEAQREFFLLAGMGITARRPNGEIQLAGNRYWDDRLIGYAGRKLMVRFDPEALHEDLLVYTMSGEPICRAMCIEDQGFDNMDAAREIERKRRAYLKSLREVADLHRELSAAEVAALLPDAAQLPGVTPSVIEMIAGNTVRKAEQKTETDADAFARGVARMSGEVIRLPEKKGGV